MISQSLINTTEFIYPVFFLINIIDEVKPTKSK
ncbi:hypothetical protein M2387_002294 [Klebsiella sp. BIGb0407]|nr:hypothetical protein [Klebsiella sp. BIGb0407]